MNVRAKTKTRIAGDGEVEGVASPAMTAPDAASRPSRGGRPRKFNEPSRPITVTLPERTLEMLARLDDDRAKAIAKAAQAIVEGPRSEGGEAEVIPIGSGSGLLVVGPSRHLRSLAFIRMVEIIPGRYILTVPSGTVVDTIEVALADLVDTVPESEKGERSLLLRLLSLLRSARRSRRMSKEEILLVGTP